MPPTTEDIVGLFHQRKRALDPAVVRMLELKDAVEDRMWIPLPEQSKAEKPLNANLIASGLYGYAERSGSVLPDVFCAPTRPGDFDVHSKRAQQRRHAIRGWWAMNRLDLGMVRRFLYYYAYATAPVVIRPRPPLTSQRQRAKARLRDIPYWHIRDPLTTLPPPGDEIDPYDCIFTFKRSHEWLRRNYPDTARVIRRPEETGPDTLFEVVEYVDDEITALVVLGSLSDRDRYSGNGHAADPWVAEQVPHVGSAPFVEIERLPNLAGICPAVVPGRICLDERVGQFNGLVGSQWWAARLMALAANAAEEDVYPEQWMVDNPGASAQIVVEADGPRGQVGHIAGGDIKTTHGPPGSATFLVLDRVTEAIRHGGAIPAEMQGEAGSNIRTARRAAQLLGSAVDFPMATAQKVMSAALEEENVRAIATVKAFYRGVKSFYFSWAGRGAYADYDPADTFDTDQNEVRYSFPGTNINDLVIGGGQRIGVGSLSKLGFMEIDPMVEDPEKEWSRVTAEAIHQALLQGFQEQVANGTVPPADAARVLKLVRANNRPLEEAIMQVQAEAQRRQASSGPPGAPDGPVPPGSPEAQPGLAAPGAGAEAPTIPEPAAGPANLSALLANLRRPARATPTG